MNFKKILTAAAAAAVLSAAGATAASADPDDHDRGYGYHDRDFDRDHGRHEGWYRDRDDHRYVDRDRIYWNLRYRHIRFYGDPFFYRGHYVVRSFDPYGRAVFVEVNPYTGGFVGFIRL
jgi:Ni/Co efflux regulator RcnB